VSSPESRPRRPRFPAPPGDLARLRTRLQAIAATLFVLASLELAAVATYVDSVPTPAQLPLPESTTVYFADGKTPMARLGTQNRKILPYARMNDAVRHSIVAAEDRTFWTNEGVDFGSVLRAAWNNLTGGRTQGASTITQQYARIAADLQGVTYSRKLREAVMAWKLDDKYDKEQILDFYLNTVPFGRGAYGIEAAAAEFFGKTADRDAAPQRQLTVAEAMLLAAMVKQPEPDPDDPEGRPGYDPTRGPVAAAEARSRWEYVRAGMVELGYLPADRAAALSFPDDVRPYDPRSRRSGLGRPTGLVVNHVLSELRQAEPFRGKPAGYLENAGLRIVTTIDKRAQDAAEAAADIRRKTAPEAVRDQPDNWQAALVSVEPGSGRVLAYYGGSDGAGADYAGWFYDAEGDATGFGQHPPGSSFKVYDLAEALRQGVSMKSRWDSPATKEFPDSGRTRDSANGPIRNASTAPCQPDCQLWQATVASLNVTFFALTEKLGAGSVIDMAIKAGVDSMWAPRPGNPRPVRIDLRGKSGADVVGDFSTEVGIGQYGITVLDHANGMATFAAGGERADAHFVREVTRDGKRVYAERLVRRNIGLNREQIDELDWTLRKVSAAHLDNGWDSAGKTGTWQHGRSVTQNAHAWMVGYTGAIAAAVWLGTTDGAPLVGRGGGGGEIFGASHAGPIWRQFMVDATAAMKLDKDKYRFGEPKFPDQTPSAAPPPSPTTPAPSSSPSDRPSRTPSCRPPECKKNDSSPSPSPSSSSPSSSSPSPAPSSPAARATPSAGALAPAAPLASIMGILATFWTRRWRVSP
jgi:membrane peptidoglycan carboxypeptidase